MPHTASKYHDQPFSFATPGGTLPDGGQVDYLKLALKYKLWLAGGLVAGVLAGHSLYQQLGPEYVATSKVLVSKRVAVPLSETESKNSGDRGQHIALIMSPLIVGKAVEAHQLQQLPSMARSKDVVEDIVDNLKVQRSAGEDNSVLNVLDITFKSTRRDDAKQIVEAIIDAYRGYLSEIHRENTNELVRLVDKANVTLREQIEAKESAYEQFRAQAPIHLKTPVRGPNGERQTVSANVHQEILEALDKERQQLLLRKAELQSLLQSVETAMAAGTSREDLAASLQFFVPGARVPELGTAAGGIGPRGALEGAGIDSQWLSLKLQEEQLLLNYGPDWPAVEGIQKQLAVLKQHYLQRGLRAPGEAPLQAGPSATGLSSASGARSGDLVDLYLLSLRQQLDALARREAEINRVYADEYANARKLAGFVEQDRKFNDDIDRLNGLWNVVRSQAAQIDLQKDNHEYTLKQISPVRDELSKKRLIKVYGGGMGAMLAFVCGLIWLREAKNRPVTAAENPVMQSSFSPPFPILATIPPLPFVPPSNHGCPATLYVYHEPASPQAETFRSLANQIISGSRAQRQILQITSPARGDGKTIIATNLAVALAQAGKQVLLVDADLEHPDLHTLMSLRNDVGLAEVLAGEVDLLTAAQSTIVGRLSVLTSGSERDQSTEFASSSFGRILGEVRRDFDFVLVDAPSIHSSVQPGTGEAIDGLVFVWRPDGSAESIRRASELLVRHGRPVVGSVANLRIQSGGSLVAERPHTATSSPPRAPEKALAHV